MVRSASSLARLVRTRMPPAPFSSILPFQTPPPRPRPVRVLTGCPARAEGGGDNSIAALEQRRTEVVPGIQAP